jgi:hypothetical protein
MMRRMSGSTIFAASFADINVAAQPFEKILDFNSEPGICSSKPNFQSSSPSLCLQGSVYFLPASLPFLSPMRDLGFKVPLQG